MLLSTLLIIWFKIWPSDDNDDDIWSNFYDNSVPWVKVDCTTFLTSSGTSKEEWHHQIPKTSERGQKGL